MNDPTKTIIIALLLAALVVTVGMDIYYDNQCVGVSDERIKRNDK